MNLTKEDVEFMEGYVEFRINLLNTGILGTQELKICELFIKILKSIEKSENDE